MVKRLHDAGIEVILDVVYNHTGEGNHLGPTLSFRGIDNVSYYRLETDRRFYTDFTGSGNMLNLEHPRVLQMVMDCLRYWARRCMSTASASISVRRSAVSRASSGATARSSTRSARIRCCRR